MELMDTFWREGVTEVMVDEDVESPVEALNRQDLLEKIKASLQPVEWQVLELHYLDGLSGKEVARRLRLSASRICQIAAMEPPLPGPRCQRRSRGSRPFS